MDKNTIKHLKQLLRQGTITWHVKNSVLNRDRELRHVGFTLAGKKKFKYFYKCQGCKEFFPHVDLLEVDHIVEIGELDTRNPMKIDWSSYIYKMYCDESNLQALCIPCHKRKTSKFSTTRLRRKVSKQPWDEEDYWNTNEVDIIEGEVTADCDLL